MRVIDASRYTYCWRKSSRVLIDLMERWMCELKIALGSDELRKCSCEEFLESVCKVLILSC